MIFDIAFPIIAIILLVVLNGMFVAAEFALVGSRTSRLRGMAEGGNKAAGWLLSVFERHAGKDSYIAVAQLGITLASIGLGMYGEPSVGKWFYGPFESLGASEGASHTLGFLAALSIITYLHVVFGEMIPKALALQSPESVSVKLNPLMRVFSAIFKPFVSVLNSIAFALMRLLRIPEPDKRMSLHTSDELSIVTDESASSGQLGELQRDLIRNIFELEERHAEEIMMSRSHIVAVDRNAPASQVMELISASPRSRYPVIDGDLDHVVGMLHIKDFIRANHTGTLGTIDSIMRELPVVAGSTSAEDLLEQFKQGNHAALVIDEFGATAGFVSLDDVIAEVMEEEIPELVERHADGSISVEGELSLSDLRDHFDDNRFDHEDVVTIAGLVQSYIGEVPQEGAMVEHGPYTLTVEVLDGRKIEQVRISAPSPEAETEPAEQDGH